MSNNDDDFYNRYTSGEQGDSAANEPGQDWSDIPEGAPVSGESVAPQHLSGFDPEQTSQVTSDFVRAAIRGATELPQPVGSYPHINGGEADASAWTGGARHAQQNPNADTWEASPHASQPDVLTVSDIDDALAQDTLAEADHATDATDEVDSPEGHTDDATSYATNNPEIEPSRPPDGPTLTQDTGSEHGGNTEIDQYGWDVGSAQPSAQGTLPNAPAQHGFNGQPPSVQDEHHRQAPIAPYPQPWPPEQVSRPWPQQPAVPGGRHANPAPYGQPPAQWPPVTNEFGHRAPPAHRAPAAHFEPRMPAGPQQPPHQMPTVPPVSIPHGTSRFEPLRQSNGASVGQTRAAIREAGLVRPHKPEATRGWRKVLRKLTAINLGPSPAERKWNDLQRRINSNLRGTYTIAVMGQKGGVSKTTTTVGLGQALAHYRDDKVVAIDGNTAKGNLANRIDEPSNGNWKTLLGDSKLDSYTDFRHHTGKDSSSGLEVLGSYKGNEVITGVQLYQATQTLGKQYPVSLIDCGNQLLDDVTAAVLAMADAVVIVSTTSLDGALAASDTINFLLAHGYPHLVSSAVVVISNVSKVPANKSVRQLHEDFERVVRAVHAVPYDPHLHEAAAIDMQRLKPGTKRAFIEAAASVADGFAGASDRDQNAMGRPGPTEWRQ